MADSQPPFIIVTPEVRATGRFATSLKQAVAETNPIVRRPLRGIQAKENTYATIRVLGPGADVALKNSSANFPEDENPVNHTSNFLLQSVSEVRSEKFQVIPTFGAPYGFFFGEQPRMMQFQAMLINSADFQWEVEWWENYEQTLRGTRLTERQARAYLYYDETMLEGYLISATTSRQAMAQHEVPMSFTMWVTAVHYLTPNGVGSRMFPESPSVPSNLLGDALGADGSVNVTELLRAQNLSAAKNKEVGLLASIRGSLDTAAAATDSLLISAKNFITGTPTVGGPANPIEGGPDVIIRFPSSGIGSPTPRAPFFANYDEYLSGNWQNAGLEQGAFEPAVELARRALASVATAAQGLPAPPPGEDAQMQDTYRAIAKVACGAFCYGAAATGADRALSRVTVPSAVAAAGALFAAKQEEQAWRQAPVPVSSASRLR